MVRAGVEGAAGAVLGHRLHADLDGLPGPVAEHVDALARAGWLERTPEGALRSTRDLDELRTARLPIPERVRSRESERLASLGAWERRVLMRWSCSICLYDRCDGRGGGSMWARWTVHRLVGTSGPPRQVVQGIHELVELAEPRKRTSCTVSSMPTPAPAPVCTCAVGRSRRRATAFDELVAVHLLSGGWRRGMADADQLASSCRAMDQTRACCVRPSMRRVRPAWSRPGHHPRLPASLFSLEEIWSAVATTRATGCVAARAGSPASRNAGIGRAQSGRDCSCCRANSRRPRRTGALVLPQGDPLAAGCPGPAHARLTAGDMRVRPRCSSRWNPWTDTGAVPWEALLGRGLVAAVEGDLTRRETMVTLRLRRGGPPLLRAHRSARGGPSSMEDCLRGRTG